MVMWWCALCKALELASCTPAFNHNAIWSQHSPYSLLLKLPTYYKNYDNFQSFNQITKNSRENEMLSLDLTYRSFTMIEVLLNHIMNTVLTWMQVIFAARIDEKRQRVRGKNTDPVRIYATEQGKENFSCI